MAAAPITTYRGTVYPWDMDHIGHPNVRVYVAKFDEANWQFAARIGLTPEYFRSRQRGLVAVQQNLSYAREVIAGDAITIRTTLTDVPARKLCFRHDMVLEADDQHQQGAGDMIVVHLDRAARRSCPLPEAVVARCREMLAEEAVA